MDLSPIQNQLFLILFLAAGLHSIYLSFLLFIKSRQQKQLWLLGLMMILVAMWLTNYLLYISKIIIQFPHLMGVFAPFLYLIAPVFYFFIRRSVFPDERIKWWDFLHLLPAVYVLIEWIPLYQFSTEVKLALAERVYQHSRPSFRQILVGNRMIWILLGYITYCYLFLQRKLSDNAYEYLRNRLIWLYRFTISFGILILIYVTAMFGFWILHFEAALLELTMVLIISAGIHVLGYFVLGKDEVLPAFIQSKLNGRYATSPLSSEQMMNILTRIQSHLKNAKPWLQSDFSATDLSNQLSVPRHHISQVLNEILSMNFNDLINQYRIQAVQKKLDSGDAGHYSIFGIAMDCGFRSKSSFHRSFKKILGMTPSEYLKKSQSNSIVNQKPGS